MEFEQDDVEALPDDFEQETELSTLEPVFKNIEIEWLKDTLCECMLYDFEERLPEDTEAIEKEIKAAIEASIDLDKLNSMLPKLYYPNGTKGKITKQDLLDYFK